MLTRWDACGVGGDSEEDESHLYWNEDDDDDSNDEMMMVMVIMGVLTFICGDDGDEDIDMISIILI